jgi:hypothetical protein
MQANQQGTTAGIPNRQHTGGRLLAEHPDVGPSADRDLGAGIPDLHTADLDAAKRIVAGVSPGARRQRRGARSTPQA